MNLRQKSNFLSLVVLILCILAAIFIYIFTGWLIVILILAPPLIHWVLKKRRKS